MSFGFAAVLFIFKGTESRERFKKTFRDAL
jgi:hypothetical protein